jgi:hypothetical protein
MPMARLALASLEGSCFARSAAAALSERHQRCAVSSGFADAGLSAAEADAEVVGPDALDRTAICIHLCDVSPGLEERAHALDRRMALQPLLR